MAESVRAKRGGGLRARCGCIAWLHVDGVRRALVSAPIVCLAFVSPLSLAAPALAKQGAPPGMVAYDKPVFKNGRRVLYHGAWRSKGGKSQAAAKSRKAPAKAQSPQAPKAAAAQAQDGRVPADAAAERRTSPLVAAPAAATGAALDNPAQAATATPGAERVRLTLAMEATLGAELAAALAPAGVDLTVVQAGDADLFLMPTPVGLSAMPATPGVVAITRLFDCEAAVVGGAGMATIGDLAGKRVAAPSESTEVGRAARRVFAAAGVHVTFLDAEGAEAAAAMRNGRADGFVAVAADPRLDDAPQGARLVAVPFAGPVREQFLPAELTKAEFPKLIAGERIDTVAQPMILAARDPGGDVARRAALSRFTAAFFTALASGALPEHKWRDVNPAAKLPFSRFEAAQAWVDRMSTQ